MPPDASGRTPGSGGPGPLIDVLVRAGDERTLADTLSAIPPRTVRNVVVIDTGAEGRIARITEEAGAVGVFERQPGEGAAYRRGIRHLSALPIPPDVVVFLPGDDGYQPADLLRLVQPIQEGKADLVLGSRILGRSQVDRPARVGMQVATSLIRAIYGYKYSDLAPFRAVRYPALVALDVTDDNDGFLVEMQVKAVKIGLRIAEVPVATQARAPSSDGVGHRLRRGAHTSYKVLFTILRHATAR